MLEIKHTRCEDSSTLSSPLKSYLAPPVDDKHSGPFDTTNSIDFA